MSLRVGLLVNPIAGIGGPAGLKGSDLGWQQALADGQSPTSLARARRFVDAVGDAVEWVTLPGCMGFDAFANTAHTPTVTRGSPVDLGHTSASDTMAGVHALTGQVDLICFVGGDGTATDVAAANPSVPCLGLPGGVKITSEVFAHDLEEAAWLVRHLAVNFETTVRDVTDLDEGAYRQGRLETRLTGSLTVPLSPVLQGGKCATTTETPLEPLVEQVLSDWDESLQWLVGAGSVCHAVKSQFWGEPTLLGVDLIKGNKIVQTDLNAKQIQAAVEADATGLLLSTIGGQGILFGRGTQVLPPRALQTIGWQKIRVVAPPEKLVGQAGLWIDTGDPTFDATAPQYLRVTSGWNETRMVRTLSGAKGQEG